MCLPDISAGIFFGETASCQFNDKAIHPDDCYALNVNLLCSENLTFTPSLSTRCVSKIVDGAESFACEVPSEPSRFLRNTKTRAL